MLGRCAVWQQCDSYNGATAAQESLGLMGGSRVARYVVQEEGRCAHACEVCALQVPLTV